MSEVRTQDRPDDSDSDDDREIRIARLHKRHRSVLLISIAVVLLAVCLEVNDGERVAVTGLSRFPVPQLCSSRVLFGVSCPGCGLTRSFIHLAHGRIAESLASHRVGWVLALVVVLQIPYRSVALRRTPVGGLDSRWPGWIASVLIVILIGNWLVAQCADFLAAG